jgi:hypothetical protein
MPARQLTTSLGACRACGAYGNSDHPWTCQPGRRLKLGRMRRGRRDSRTSWAARVYARTQDAAIRALLVERGPRDATRVSHSEAPAR